jgi:hypothetical protein
VGFGGGGVEVRARDGAWLFWEEVDDRVVGLEEDWTCDSEV